MSLPHILLGLLEKPASGFDIKKEFEESLAFFWSADLAQVYPTLKKLHAEGKVDRWTEPSDKGPDRILYVRTEAGLHDLTAWLARGPRVATERRHYLAQVFFLHTLESRSDQVAFFRLLRATMSEKADRIASMVPLWKELHGDAFPDALPEDEFFHHMTFELGQEIFELYVRWCDRCLERLQSRTAPLRRPR